MDHLFERRADHARRAKCLDLFTRVPVRSGPPALGAHTESILLSLGHSREEIEALRAAGVVGPALALTRPPWTAERLRPRAGPPRFAP